ncbi:pentapeptide repeat-containing protein [uncultured Helicobacter sp.]|uniref:pentapeptide repeat-containing protein n=1 Tax=uncultured Helicobacter sp. TaxID=175537 RepID=UPI002639DDA4|nr:pentapeptide repeat-containing protein [uncultured Helicobacter sp.]
MNSGNTENDFSVFLNSLADDENYQKITRNQNTIIVNERVYIQFNERLENKYFNLSNITFNKEVTFKGNFEGLQFVFDNTHFKQLNIFDCKIDSIVFNGETHNRGEFNISNCEIKTTIVDSNIQGNISFMKCKFDDFNMLNADKNIDCAAKFIFNFCEVKGIANFMNFKFRDKVSFKMSNFRDNIYFNNSHFYDFADFHECEFEKTACFYGATFDNPPNFSQAIFKENLNFVNVKCDFEFENLKERIKQEKEQDSKKTLDKFANDFRDSFRLIKNALIKDNNLLDASNFHKYELYCKEIELDSKNPKIFSKDFIDKWQLFFYRITSNHHTDLLKSFHSLLVVIGIFAFLNIATIIGFNCYCLQNISLSPYTLIAHHNAIIKHLLNCNYISLLGINFALAVVFILLFCFSLCSKIRKIIISLSYFLVLLLLISLPQYIIPTISIFTDKRPLLDPLSIIGGIYTLLFAIMFFSLIKTARKNSIIPH